MKVDVDRMNKTIGEIEGQSEKLKSIAIAYEELDKLQREIAAGAEVNENILSDFEGLNKKFQEMLDNHSDRWNKINEEFTEFRRNIEKDLELFREENKNIYKTLEDSVFLRLEKHRSDIQIDIRNEGAQVERSLKNSMDDKFASVDRSFKDRFETIEGNIIKRLSKQNAIIIAVAGVSLLNLVLLVIMLVTR